MVRSLFLYFALAGSLLQESQAQRMPNSALPASPSTEKSNGISVPQTSPPAGAQAQAPTPNVPPAEWLKPPPNKPTRPTTTPNSCDDYSKKYGKPHPAC